MLKSRIFITCISLCLLACQTQTENLPIQGTWKLQQATLIEKGDTTVTDYTKNLSFIKIINNSHFAFLSHSLPTATDTTYTYTSGGGKYQLKDSTYTEHLEYCSDRAWQNHNFQFTLSLHGDTLTQTGIEKIPSEGIDRLNIEKYIKVR